MATFTQPINPLNAPDYGSKSRPVDIDQGIKPQGVAQNSILPHGVMQGDESAKYAGEAAGAAIKEQSVANEGYVALFKGVAESADFLGKAGVSLVKKDIEDKVYAVADKERQSYTDLLEKIKSGTGVRNVLDANASMDENEEVPKEVSSLPDNLAALQGARDSGKISGTYYQSRLLAEAKSLRAQYPGFREYIDQTFSKVTGSNPANAYVQSLVSDINRAATSQASQKNKMLGFILQNQEIIPDGPNVYAKYQAGQMTDQDVLSLAYPGLRAKSDLTMGNLIFQNQKMTREDKERLAGVQIDKAAGLAVNTVVQNLTAKMGLNTSEDLDKLSSMDKAGTITGPMWQQYGQVTASAIAQLKTTMIADANTHGYVEAAGGADAVNKRIETALEPLKAIQDRIYNHDFGGIYDTKRQIETQNNELIQKLRDNPKFGSYFQVNQAVKDIGGEQNLQKFNLNAIKGDFDKDFSGYFNVLTKNIGTQYNMKTNGIPLTFNDVISDLKANKVKDGKFNEAVLNEVKKITDPSLPEDMRVNYAIAAFSPQNRGMISSLQADGKDAKGRPITGQTAIYQRFTSPEMTASMYELGKKNPEIWKQYVNWAQETFSNELMPRELQKLGNIKSDTFPYSQIESYDHVGWDAANHRLVYSFTPPPGSVNTPSSGVGEAVNRINGNMENLKHIARASKMSPADTDAFLIKTIADNAGADVLRNVDSIPYKLLRDMGLAKQVDQTAP